MARILVFGANALIVEETLKIWAHRGDEFFLIARTMSKLDTLATQLTALGSPKVGKAAADLGDLPCLAALYKAGEDFLGYVDVLYIGHGYLGKEDLWDAEDALRVMTANYTSFVTILSYAYTAMQKRPGTIACITSVAGDVPRKRGYIYGSSKAAMDFYLAGMRAKLAPKGVKVITLKPGFTDTPMTQGMHPGGPLWSSAQTVARGIVKAIDRGQDIVFLPWFWCMIMKLLQAVPQRMLRRLPV